jgi:hypothetical protein
MERLLIALSFPNLDLAYDVLVHVTPHPALAGL